MVDQRKSLDELEGRPWPDPDLDSYLASTVHRLRSKPLADLSDEDLRIMVGQGISTDVLLPIAVERLDADPLLSGDFYPGDLLAACCNLDSELLRSHPAHLTRLRAIAERALLSLGSVAAPPELRHDLEAFLS